MDELADLRTLLASPQTGIRLVLTPERVVAAETRRTLTALALLGLHVDGLVANRMLPVPPADASGEAARWLRERGDRAGGGARRRGAASGLPRAHRRARRGRADGRRAHCSRLAGRTCGATTTRRPSGPPAAPLLAVRRTAGSRPLARTRSSSSRCTCPAPASAPLDLARIGDELAVTVAGVRRLVALPAVLRRCTVTRARLDGDDLRVAFRPDPALWLR